MTTTATTATVLAAAEARFTAANDACITAWNTPAYGAACVEYRAALAAVFALRA